VKPHQFLTKTAKMRKLQRAMEYADPKRAGQITRALVNAKWKR
jgi:hypothetical protein